MAKQATTDRTDSLNRSDRCTSTGQIGSVNRSDRFPQQIASTSTQPNSSSNFEKILAKYKNDLAKLIKENLEVDVRGKTQAYQKPHPISLDTVYYSASFSLSEFVKFNGEDNKSTFDHISQYLAQFREAGSISKLNTLIFFIFNWTAFSWLVLLLLILLPHGNNYQSKSFLIIFFGN